MFNPPKFFRFIWSVHAIPKRINGNISEVHHKKFSILFSVACIPCGLSMTDPYGYISNYDQSISETFEYICWRVFCHLAQPKKMGKILFSNCRWYSSGMYLLLLQLLVFINLIALMRFKSVLIQGVPHQSPTGTNFRAIGIKLVLVELLPDCYVVKFILVEIGYLVPTSTNFEQYDFFQIPKMVLSEDSLQLI